MKAGDDISIVYRGVVRATIVWSHATYFVAAWVADRPIMLTLENEGILWVHGHDGPAVDALRTAAALASPE